MNVIFKSFIATFCAAAIFMQPLFFSFLGLLGVEYEGVENSPIYVAYVVAIAGSMLLTYIAATFKAGILKGETIILVITIALFGLHALWVMFDPVRTQLIPEFLVFTLLFGVPGFLSAATAIKLNILPGLIRVSEVFVILIAIGIIQFSVLPSLGGVRTASLAGANYQTLSYYAALTFGMLLAYNLHLPKTLRLKITSRAWFKPFSYALMLGCLIACLLGGGRGAFVLLLAYFLMGTIPMFLNRKNIFTGRGLAVTALKLGSVILIAAVFLTSFWDNTFIQSGYQRATQFISADGSIDLASGSSGRDIVYTRSLEYIEQQPVLGYGPFGFRDKSIHAHNLFLEVWLQLGILGLIAFVIIGIAVFIRMIKHRTIYTVWVLTLFLYPLTMTMFSGAYMHSTIFIFGLSFLVIFSKYKHINSECPV